MNAETMDILCKLTSEFYARCTDSFSATRERPWHGWNICLDAIASKHSGDEISVFDVACGNMRFEAFLAQRLDADLDLFAIDSCPKLVPAGSSASFIEMDVIAALRDGSFLREVENVPQCDLACSFGFFHHIPTQKLRLSLLDALIAKTTPGGFVMVSLWQFARNGKLFAKAEKATERARADHPMLELEEGDWLLGWQDSDDVYRYCHSFSEEDIVELVEHSRPAARIVASFQADGMGDDLNRYLVFRREPLAKSLA